MVKINEENKKNFCVKKSSYKYIQIFNGKHEQNKEAHGES